MRIANVLAPSLLAASLAAATAQGQTPLLIYGGPTYLNPDLRSATGADWGAAGGIAALLGESGMIGMPSLDIDVRGVRGDGVDLYTLETSYAERALVSDRYWIGIGIGSNWMRAKIDPVEPGEASRSERKWSISGKATMGYLITDRAFLEATYHYTGEMLGIDTASTTIALGYWF